MINNRVTVLVDTLERPEDIDVKRAQEALERAQRAAPSEAEPAGILYFQAGSFKSYGPYESHQGPGYLIKQKKGRTETV